MDTQPIKLTPGSADAAQGQPIVVNASKIEVRAAEAKVIAPQAVGVAPSGGAAEQARRIDQMAAVDAERMRRAEVVRQERVRQMEAQQAGGVEAPPTAPIEAPPVPAPMTATQLGRQYAREQEEVKQRAKFEKDRSAKMEANRAAIDQQYAQSRKIDVPVPPTVGGESPKPQATEPPKVAPAKPGQMVPEDARKAEMEKGASEGMAAGPEGAVVGAVVGSILGEAKNFESAIKATTEWSKAIVTVDADKVARGFADLTGKIPVLGSAIQTTAHGILDLSGAAMDEGRRLSRFSGELAGIYAGIDVRAIQRDIERAQGPAGRAYVEHAQARQDFNERIFEIAQRLEPHLVTGLTNLVNGGTQLFEATKQGFNNLIEGIAKWLDNVLAHGLADDLRRNWRISLNLQREAMRQRETPNPFVDQLLAMRRPQAAIDAEAERLRRLRQNVADRGTLFPGL